MVKLATERRIARELKQQLQQASGLPRIDTLTADQLDAYNAWREAREYWKRRLFSEQPAALYEALLNDEWRGPELPRAIATTLWPNSPTTTAAANVDSLRELYQRMCEL